MGPEEKTGNCPHQSKIKAFFVTSNRWHKKKPNMPNLACGHVPNPVCVWALMQVLLLPVGRGIAGPCFTCTYLLVGPVRVPGLVSRASPFTKKEGSGMAPLLELFCWNAINITCATYFYASLGHCACACGDKLTVHTACRPGALLHVWFTLTYCGHAAATKFAYSCSPGSLGKRTTRVTAPYQTLPFL